MTNSADPDQLVSLKPTDLDLHCLQRQGISGFSRTRVEIDSKDPVRKSKKYFSYSYFFFETCCVYSLEVPLWDTLMSIHNLHFMEK